MRCKGSDIKVDAICIPDRIAHASCRTCGEMFTKYLHQFGEDDRRRLSNLKLKTNSRR